MSNGNDAALVRNAWSRVVKWLELNAPDHADALNPPAAEDEIAATEISMGVRFPMELRMWLMMNNGSTALHLKDNNYVGADYGLLSPLPNQYAFLDLGTISGVYAGKSEYQRQMKVSGDDSKYWAHNWIPVVQKFDADYGLFVNASEGSACPVYEYEEDYVAEVGHTPPTFPSLGTYLTNVADALEGVSSWGRREGYDGKFPVVSEGILRW